MNQPLYDPAAVGGRGQLTIEARHPDGRYHISIAVRRRVRLLSTIALVPFPAYGWMHLPDQPAETPESHRAESHLVLELLSAAQLLFSQAKRTETALEALGQRTQPNLAELSFLLLKYFSLKCSDAQAHLEDCSAISRGQRLLGWLCELMSLQARQDPEQTRIHPNDWADVSVLSLRRAQKHTGLISEPGSR
jgi:Lon protease-like protein